MSLYVRSTLYKKRKENYGVVFSEFWFNKIYTFWFQKWPKDGPSYDNATKMLKFMLPEAKL